MVPGERVLRAVNPGDWLCVAADRLELRGMIRQGSGLRRLKWPVDWAHEQWLGGRRVVCVANGPGFLLARKAVEVASERMTSISRLLSIGLCGALNPAYGKGDIFVAERIRVAETGDMYRAEVPEARRRHVRGLLVSMDRVAQTPAEKAALRKEHDADAVDMEAGAVAAQAQRLGVAFACIRVVSDLAEEGFDLDWNACRSAEGRFLGRKILWAAFERPHVRIPELMRLYRLSLETARTLGEFLAECEFR